MPSYTRPEVICTTLIAAATALTRGTDLFDGPPRPALESNNIPRNCVFCYGMFSFQPIPYLGTNEDFRDFRVTTLVRQVHSQYETGSNLARDIWQALQRADVSAYTGFVYSLNAEADVTYMGFR